MNHEYDQHRKGSSAAATTQDGTAEPGQSSRSALLRRPEQPIASGLVQRRSNAAGEAEPPAVHAAAAQGVATASSQLPYLETIQRAFGHHDISSVQAHTGPDAVASANAMGAQAFATGNHVVLGSGTDLHTVAHEAAHVVQQRGGVQLKGGVGEVGDAHEQHANAVADAVVAGKSAESLLNNYAGSSSGSSGMGSRAARGELVGGAPAQPGTAAGRPGAAVAAAIVQRKIGEGGESLVGTNVIENGKARPWTIKGARGAGSKLEYQLDFNGLMQKWVSAEDEKWSIYTEPEKPLSEEQLALARRIDEATTDGASGVIDGYERNLIEMADIHASSAGAWSGGASDCVIVGCFTGSQVMMTHADRTSTALANRVIRNASGVVYLASEAFSKGGKEAIKNGNVLEILSAIDKENKGFRVFAAKQMAISPTGEVFTSFPIPKRE